MSDPLSDDPHVPPLPEGAARPPVAPPVQGTAPSVDDEPGFSLPSEEQLVMEARARQALREAALRGETAPERPFSAQRGFGLQSGGRSAMAETAGRIGAAVGNAHREVRRKLELVRHPTGSIEFPSATAADIAERGKQLIQEVEAEVSDLRHQAARKLENLSEQAEERLQEYRREARVVLRRTTLRARELAEAYPLQTIAAVAGTFFVVGVALRLRRSNRG